MSEILLIEDEPGMAEFIRRGLTKERHRVDHVATAELVRLGWTVWQPG